MTGSLLGAKEPISATRRRHMHGPAYLGEGVPAVLEVEHMLQPMIWARPAMKAKLDRRHDEDGMPGEIVAHIELA